MCIIKLAKSLSVLQYVLLGFHRYVRPSQYLSILLNNAKSNFFLFLPVKVTNELDNRHNICISIILVKI